MKRLDEVSMVLKIAMAIVFVASAIGACWWALFALKPYDISHREWTALYAHTQATASAPSAQLGVVETVKVGQTSVWAQPLSYATFDGTPVLGRIVYPTDPSVYAAGAPKRPVLLALHGMGRTHWRWWQGEFKGRATIESTHLLAERALNSGHVVMALDARLHGDRKDPLRPLTPRAMMWNLNVWGERAPYEQMIVDTVKDYRMALDWLAAQAWVDQDRIRVTGYSMGAQMALLLAAADNRVRSVAAMVPPHLDRKVAAVAPSTAARFLSGVEVWLLTAEHDEYAPHQDNLELFAALPGPDKTHLTFPGGHLLPASYVEAIQTWLSSTPPVPGEPGLR